MICRVCHAANNDGDKFCEQCGSPLGAGGDQVHQGGDENLGATLMAAPPDSPALVRLGSGGGQSYTLQSRAIVGRLETCDIQVDDKSVSREHARLSRLRDGYVVEDLGSTNGTQVNGKRIKEAVLLHPEDKITFGAIEFRYESGATAPEAGVANQRNGEPAGGSDNEDIFEPPTMQDLEPLSPRFPSPSPFPPAVVPQAFTPEQARDGEENGQRQSLAEAHTRTEDTPEPIDMPANPNRREPPLIGPDRASGPVLAGSSDLTDRALTVAHDLGSIVEELVRTLNETEAVQSGLEERVRSLEGVRGVQEEIKRILNTSPPRSTPRGQINSVQDMLDSLIKNPRDVEILMSIGNQASSIGGIVNEYTQLRRVVEKIAAQLDVSLPS